MKKQLLFTIALLGALTFGFAQTAISYVAATAGEQTFSVGQEGSDDLGADIATITSATGSVATNNGFIGLLANDTDDDGVTGTLSFTLTTDSASSIDTDLTLEVTKRKGISTVGTVSVTGYPDLPFNYGSEGSATGVENKSIEFGTISLITGTDLTVTITLTSMTHVESTQAGILRMTEVKVAEVPTPTKISYVAATAGDQTFTVGQEDGDDLQVPIATITSATGTVATNNAFIGIAAPAITDNDVTGTFVFTVTTDSATPIDRYLTLDIGKRKGISTVGTVSVTNHPDVPFNLASEGSTTGTEGKEINFGLISLSSGTDLTVTVTLTSMTHVESTQTGIFRLENVFVNETPSLGIDDVTLANSISLYPNPTTDTFKLSSSNTIESVQIYSVTGSVLKTFSTQESYNISDLATGIYIANIKTALGSTSLRIVKD